MRLRGATSVAAAKTTITRRRTPFLACDECGDAVVVEVVAGGTLRWCGDGKERRQRWWRVAVESFSGGVVVG